MSTNEISTTELIKQQIKNLDIESSVVESGVVVYTGDGIVKAYGLSEAFLGEIVKFDSGSLGVVSNLASDSVGIIMLDSVSDVKNGDVVTRTNQTLKVNSGMQVLSRVLDGIGKPIDGKAELNKDHVLDVEVKAPGIIERKSVHETFHTGVKIVDALIPIGKGQRELIIGDRETGKSSIIMDSILSQKHFNSKAKSDKDKVFCVYVAIGQKRSTVAQMVSELEKSGAMEYTCVVAATASDTAAMQYLAPYTGCAIAEYFRDNGMHAVVYYDDLSKQAVAYRQISLLLRRPPGREAYPGDIFYLHSRLLERAAKLDEENGSGSLTAIPVVETQGSDISAYIPTNVISITDGQIFLERELFYQSIRPAVNAGTSVSRVGRAAQTKAMKKVSGSIKLELAQYRDVAKFSQFASDLDDSTKKQIEKGKRLTEILKQPQGAPYKLSQEIMAIISATEGFLDDIAVEDVQDYEAKMLSQAEVEIADVLENMDNTGDFTDEEAKKINKFLADFTKEYIGINYGE